MSSGQCAICYQVKNVTFARLRLSLLCWSLLSTTTSDTSVATFHSRMNGIPATLLHLPNPSVKKSTCEILRSAHTSNLRVNLGCRPKVIRMAPTAQIPRLSSGSTQLMQSIKGKNGSRDSFVLSFPFEMVISWKQSKCPNEGTG